ncbi:MAG: hypothetical protein ACOZCO_16250 [Bacteroidota bacterium]
MNKLMKLLMLIFVFSAQLPGSFAQTNSSSEKNNVTYRIIDSEKYSNIDSYIRALDKADFSHHRLRNSSFIIRFENGPEVEIFSAADLQSKNLLKHEITFYPESYSEARHKAVFKLAENDNIIEVRPNENVKFR